MDWFTWHAFCHVAMWSQLHKIDAIDYNTNQILKLPVTGVEYALCIP